MFYVDRPVIGFFLEKKYDRIGGRMPKKLVLFTLGMIMFFAANSLSQNADLEPAANFAVPFKLVDFPTAGTLPRASFDVELDAYSEGGILGYINIGLHNRFMLGISYGGERILGDGNVEWHERPDYLVKVRLVDESITFPAIAVGFESQGTGIYNDSLERYQFKAPGFYLVLSKGYRTLSWVSGVHAGINLNTIENSKDNDDDISFYAGFDITFNRNLSLVGEYQAALNDDGGNSLYGRGRGYLNMGAIWTFSDRMQLGAIFKDLLDNSRASESITRELRIIYTERF
jgi:hypothetical protein